MRNDKVKFIVEVIGWLGVIWGIAFVMVVGISNYALIHGSETFYGISVLNVRDHRLVFLSGAPSLIALCAYEVIRKRWLSND